MSVRVGPQLPWSRRRALAVTFAVTTFAAATVTVLDIDPSGLETCNTKEVFPAMPRTCPVIDVAESVVEEIALLASRSLLPLTNPVPVTLITKLDGVIAVTDALAIAGARF